MIHILKKILRWTLGLSGAAALLFVALSFTDLPYLAYHRLGVSSDSLQGQPGLIVLLGGAGTAVYVGGLASFRLLSVGDTYAVLRSAVRRAG